MLEKELDLLKVYKVYNRHKWKPMNVEMKTKKSNFTLPHTIKVTFFPFHSHQD